jgi:hypothetical protein
MADLGIVSSVAGTSGTDRHSHTECEYDMEAISSNHFSHDQQVVDVMDYLEHNDGIAYSHLINMFPEYLRVTFGDSPTSAWIDTDAMDVDVDFMGWLTDEIEACCNIMWHDGEPYMISDEDYTHDADEFFDDFIFSDDDAAYAVVAS